jgi:hypothetical protein
VFIGDGRSRVKSPFCNAPAQNGAARIRLSRVDPGFALDSRGETMSDDLREIEMRVEGVSTPDGLGPVETAIRACDPDATVRLDPATGIIHAMTRRDTLEVVAALSKAGFEASAMTL